MNSPIDLFLLLEEKISGNARPISGMANALIENLPKPKKAIIQAVTVVPILAPIMTPID